jgi:hypothetical protein
MDCTLSDYEAKIKTALVVRREQEDNLTARTLVNIAIKITAN